MERITFKRETLLRQSSDTLTENILALSNLLDSVEELTKRLSLALDTASKDVASTKRVLSQYRTLIEKGGAK